MNDALTELLVSCTDMAAVGAPTSDIDTGALKEMAHSHILHSHRLPPFLDLLRWRPTKLNRARVGPKRSFETRLLMLLGHSLGAAGYTSRLEPTIDDSIAREIMKRIAADAVDRLSLPEDDKHVR